MIDNKCWCCGEQREENAPYMLCLKCEFRESNERLKHINIDQGSPHFLLLLNPDNPLYQKAEKMIDNSKERFIAIDLNTPEFIEKWSKDCEERNRLSGLDDES